MNAKPLKVTPLLLPIVLSLLGGLWAGLLRIGWQLPPIQPRIIGVHGPLMVSGFIGTLVAVERVVALRQRWCLASPLLCGLGAMVLLVGASMKLSAALIALGSLGMVLISAEILRQEKALHTWTIAVGSLAWLGGNLLWLFGGRMSVIGYWWGSFLLLVIAGERLELTRVRRLPRWAQQLFGSIVGIFCAGLLLSIYDYAWGMRVASGAAVLLALWLIVFDLARRNVHKSGLVRYIALNLLPGYCWLAVSGILGLLYSPMTSGLRFDAWLHTLYLGFVIGMVFAHAPLILPAISGLTVTYHPRFYIAPALLQLSLLSRVIADLATMPVLRRWSGLFNEVAILLFLAIMLHAAWRSRKMESDHGSTDGQQNGPQSA